LPARIGCFLTHLVAEKSLKALLIHSGVPFKKSHDLVELHDLLPVDLQPGFAATDLRAINPWVIEGRYEDSLPEASHEQARKLVDQAELVLAEAQRRILPQGER